MAELEISDLRLRRCFNHEISVRWKGMARVSSGLNLLAQSPLK